MMSLPDTKRTVAGHLGGKRNTAALRVDPEPRYELSPYLYMQFMEPLGAPTVRSRRRGITGATAGART